VRIVADGALALLGRPVRVLLLDEILVMALEAEGFQVVRCLNFE
jgi:hypothetical protein